MMFNEKQLGSVLIILHPEYTLETLEVTAASAVTYEEGTPLKADGTVATAIADVVGLAYCHGDLEAGNKAQIVIVPKVKPSGVSINESSAPATLTPLLPALKNLGFDIKK